MSDLIEVIPGKVSGVPLVRGTRLPVQCLIDNFNDGMSPAEIADLYGGVDAETVAAVLRQVKELGGPSPS